MTPRRADRPARLGSRSIEEVLAANLRSYRSMRRLNQDQVAEGMTAFRHEWSRTTVSSIERQQRNITVNELLPLCAVLGITLPQLLDPTHGSDLPLDIGAETPLKAVVAEAWLSGSHHFDRIGGLA